MQCFRARDFRCTIYRDLPSVFTRGMLEIKQLAGRINMTDYVDPCVVHIDQQLVIGV